MMGLICNIPDEVIEIFTGGGWVVRGGVRIWRRMSLNGVERVDRGLPLTNDGG